jgi:hypothetical protein
MFHIAPPSTEARSSSKYYIYNVAKSPLNVKKIVKRVSRLNFQHLVVASFKIVI